MALGLEMLVLVVLVEQQASPRKEQVIPPQLVQERVPQELVVQEPMEVTPAKELEGELKERVPLLILPQKKGELVVPPQLVQKRVPQELVEG